MSYTPKTVVLVNWPHSQRIMAHPEAMAVDCDSDGDGSYVVPAEVWEQWKDGYYVAEDEDFEEEKKCDVASKTIDARAAMAAALATAKETAWNEAPNEMCAICDAEIDGGHSYCDKCDMPVCDDCQGSIDPNPNHYRYCVNCC
jgi:hypothetical protein